MKRFWLTLAIAAWLALLVAWASGNAEAASLRVCFKPPTNPDAITARIYAGVTALAPDVTGLTVDPTVTQTCATFPVPATRGTPVDYTAKFVNAFGEEGPASNAITFRAPAVPSAPALLSVGGTAQP